MRCLIITFGIEVDTSNNVTRIAKAEESAGGTGPASS